MSTNQHREASDRRQTSHEAKPEQAERFTRERTQAEEMVEQSRYGKKV